MTLLYRPVLIETAEQAEALPAGTVALTSLNGEQASAGKIGNDLWMVAGDWPDYSNEDAVGWTALAPIEAEEETREAGGVDHLHGSAYYWPALRRFVTPWVPVEGEALAEGGDGA